jgi:hypothetical protein
MTKDQASLLASIIGRVSAPVLAPREVGSFLAAFNALRAIAEGEVVAEPAAKPLEPKENL